MPGAWGLWRQSLALIGRHARLMLALLALAIVLLLIAAPLAVGDGPRLRDSPGRALVSWVALFGALTVFSMLVALATGEQDGQREPLRVLFKRGCRGAARLMLFAVVLGFGAFFLALWVLSSSAWGLLLVFGLPLWLAVRLMPLPGVFAEESLWLAGGVRRAWALSSGHGWLIARGYLGYLALNFALLLLPPGMSMAVVLTVVAVMIALWLVLACWIGLLYRALARTDA